MSQIPATGKSNQITNQMGAALPGGKSKSNQMPGAGRTNQIEWGRGEKGGGWTNGQTPNKQLFDFHDLLGMQRPLFACKGMTSSRIIPQLEVAANRVIDVGGLYFRHTAFIVYCLGVAVATRFVQKCNP
jgi:hypothetical protein